MKKHTYQYIIITDPLGAVYQQTPVPINHRAIIVDRSSFLGIENVGKKFTSEREFMMFAEAIVKSSSGTFSNGFTWQYDGPVQDKLP